MKRCSKCQRELSSDHFNKKAASKDGLQGHCKDCNRDRLQKHYRSNKPYYVRKAKKWRDNRKDEIDAIKATPCFDCKRSYPPYIMDFDHRDAGSKEFCIGFGRQSRSKEAVDKEILKCDIVCSNCHRERTYQRQQAVVAEFGLGASL